MHEDPPIRVAGQDEHAAVDEPAGVRVGTAGLARDLVVLVDDVEDLVRRPRLLRHGLHPSSRGRGGRLSPAAPYAAPPRTAPPARTRRGRPGTPRPARPGAGPAPARTGARPPPPRRHRPRARPAPRAARPGRGSSG